MPPAQPESLDIERLLGELHRKKRWLDMVIAGLEQSAQSPELRFVEAVQTLFEDGQTPRADISADLVRPGRSRSAVGTKVNTPPLGAGKYESVGGRPAERVPPIPRSLSRGPLFFHSSYHS